MGLVELLVLIVVVVCVCALAVWIVGQIGNVPAIVPKLIWILCVVTIVVMLLAAFGILGADIQIPRLR